MNKTMQAALRELYAHHVKGRPFYWRIASMRKLEAEGYVVTAMDDLFLNCFKITQKGVDFCKALEGEAERQ